METNIYAKHLAEEVHKHNPGAKIQWYLTWGRPFGDSDRCSSIPKVCTYEGMQDSVTKTYTTYGCMFKVHGVEISRFYSHCSFFHTVKLKRFYTTAWTSCSSWRSIQRIQSHLWWRIFYPLQHQWSFRPPCSSKRKLPICLCSFFDFVSRFKLWKFLSRKSE